MSDEHDNAEHDNAEHETTEHETTEHETTKYGGTNSDTTASDARNSDTTASDARNSDTTDEEHEELLREQALQRYGAYRHAKPAWLKRTIVIVLFVAMIMGSIWYAWVKYEQTTQDDVTAKDSGFTINKDRTIDIGVDVTRKDPSDDAYCILRARDFAGFEVARQDLYVPATNEKTTRIRTVIYATRKPVIADVYGCSSNVPSWLDKKLDGTIE